MIRKTITSILCCLLAFSFTSCDEDVETYAELLAAEKEAIAEFLAKYEVSETIPADTIFDKDTYYLLDDGIYMRVINAGDKNIMAEKGDKVAFRYERINLLDFSVDLGILNAPLVNPYTFIFRLYEPTYSEHTEYGTAVGEPLYYLGQGAKVSLVVPSKYGFPDEIQAVTPFAYTIDYPRIYKK